MKKNAMLKIAAILMVAVLLTTCAISSTFAKYVTAGDEVITNQARVAKWGLSITAATPATGAADDDGNIKLFLNSYDGGSDLSVKGDSEAIVIAPGTSNSSDAFTITLAGTPEVAYKLIVEADLSLSGWTTTEGYYCPLAITVDGAATPIYGNSYDTAEEFATAVENAIAAAILGTTVAKGSDGKYTLSYAPLTEVPASAKDGVSVSWAWAFDDTVTGNPAGIDNDLDTELGNAANSKIQISFSVSAEQIDTYTAPAQGN